MPYIYFFLARLLLELDREELELDLAFDTLREDELRLGALLTVDLEDELRLGERLTVDREGVRLLVTAEERDEVVRLGALLTVDLEDELRLDEDEYFLTADSDLRAADRLGVDLTACLDDRLVLDEYFFVVGALLELPVARVEEEELELLFFTAEAAVWEPDLDEAERLVPGS